MSRSGRRHRLLVAHTSLRAHLPPRFITDREDLVTGGVRRPRSGDPCARTDRADGVSRGKCESVERAQEHAPAKGPDRPVPRPGETGTALELLVHGVGGTTPQEMLNDPRTVRITGDNIAAVFRRADDVDAETSSAAHRDGPVPEAYVWCNLTSGNGTRALWLLLLPFMVINLAHWMRPCSRGRRRTVRLYGLLVRLAGLTLTVLLVAAACEVALDLAAWQCAGTRACADRHSWLGFLSPTVSDGGWWSSPGRRLALASFVPAALTGLLWYLSRRTWSDYESQQPLSRDPEPEEDGGPTALGRPGFWYGRRLVARLRAAHTAAGLVTVAAAVASAAARHDRRPGGPAVLNTLGVLLEAALAACAVAVVWVVCRRGRSERRLDRQLDERFVRRLPLVALVLLALCLLYAAWERPGWESSGRLPGDATFGGVALVQGLLVIVLAAVAHVLHRTDPDRRSVLRGLGGPAVAML
ncbi:integral membrane protein, partial [Streptomyces viridochromogenes DSM 40736]